MWPLLANLAVSSSNVKAIELSRGAAAVLQPANDLCTAVTLTWLLAAVYQHVVRRLLAGVGSEAHEAVAGLGVEADRGAEVGLRLLRPRPRHQQRELLHLAQQTYGGASSIHSGLVVL